MNASKLQHRVTRTRVKAASCWNSADYDGPSGSGESWFEPRRGNEARQRLSCCRAFPICDRRPRDHAAAVASPSRPDRRPGSCSSDSHGSLKRETQIDSIRSQSAYSAAIGTRQARTRSRPGRLSRMPGVLRSSRRPLRLRICLQSPNPALSTLAQGGDGIHLRRAVCRETAS